jgi:hypothetical protein
VKIGVGLPNPVPNIPGNLLVDWAQRAEAAGGRPDDYEVAGRDFRRRGREFDDDFDVMHRVWRGEPLAARRSVSQVRDVTKGFEEAGFNEFNLDPTAATLDQIDRLAEAVL